MGSAMAGRGIRRTWKRVLVLLAVVGLVALVVYIRFRDSKEAYNQQFNNTRSVIGRLVLDWHEPSGILSGMLDDLLAREPELVHANSTNRGAEILWRILPRPSQGPSDTDKDGRPERRDFSGDPLIFLFNGCPQDTIVFENGAEMPIEAPPYVDLRQGRFYINAIAFHTWYQHFSEALQQERRLSSESRAAD